MSQSSAESKPPMEGFEAVADPEVLKGAQKIMYQLSSYQPPPPRRHLSQMHTTNSFYTEKDGSLKKNWSQ